MASGRRRSLPNPLLALNEGLDDILVELKGVVSVCPSSLKERVEEYSHLRPNNMLSAFEKYMELLPPPGSTLSSKDLVVVHNLREILSGAFLLFEAKSRRLIDGIGGQISEIEKDLRKRPAPKDPMRNRAAKDPLVVISMIAEAAAVAPPRSTVEYLQDFDLALAFEEKANYRDETRITMEEVPFHSGPPSFNEFHLDTIDDTEFERLLVEMELIRKGKPTAQPPTFMGALDEMLDPQLNIAQPLRAEAILEDASAELPCPDPKINIEDVLPDVGAFIREGAPVETIPPVAVPRIEIGPSSVSRDSAMNMREMIANLMAHPADRQTTPDKPKRTYRKKNSLPVGLLKKDRSRGNLMLTGARVNRIIEKRSNVDVDSQKWMRALRMREDPFDEDVLLKEATECVYKYKYHKKYPYRRDDSNLYDTAAQPSLEETIMEVLLAHTPLRAHESRTSALSGQTPQRLAVPSPSPRLPAIELPPTEVPMETSPDKSELPLVAHPPEVEPEIPRTTELLPPLSVPLELSKDPSELLQVIHSPVSRKTSEQVLLRRRVDLPEDQLEVIPAAPGLEPATKRRVERDEVCGSHGAPGPTGSPIVRDAKEELRDQIVKKLSEAFAEDTSTVFAFTDLCPLTSTKHFASQVFYVLIELWGGGDVDLSQESPKPQHIYIKAGRKYSSSMETCSESTSS